MSELVLLDPTAERDDPASRPLAPALPADAAARLVLLDISKPRGDVFLEELERLLRKRGHATERTSKPTFTKPAPADLRREIAEHCDAIIEALAD